MASSRSNVRLELAGFKECRWPAAWSTRFLEVLKQSGLTSAL